MIIMTKMLNMTGANGKKSRPARMIGTSIYPSPALRERLERELQARRARDGAMAWSLSSVVIDLLHDALGMETTRQDTGNGR